MHACFKRHARVSQQQILPGMWNQSEEAVWRTLPSSYKPRPQKGSSRPRHRASALGLGMQGLLGWMRRSRWVQRDHRCSPSQLALPVTTHYLPRKTTWLSVRSISVPFDISGWCLFERLWLLKYHVFGCKTTHIHLPMKWNISLAIYGDFQYAYKHKCSRESCTWSKETPLVNGSAMQCVPGVCHRPWIKGGLLRQVPDRIRTVSNQMIPRESKNRRGREQRPTELT